MLISSPPENKSIYDSTIAIFYQKFGPEIGFYLVQSLNLAACLYLGVIGSQHKMISIAVLIFFLLATADIKDLLDIVQQQVYYFRQYNTLSTKAELVMFSDIVLAIVIIACISFMISFIAVRILDIFVIGICGIKFYNILRSSVCPVLYKTWGEPSSLVGRTLSYIIVFCIIYYFCKKSMVLFYTLFFSVVASIGCFRTSENVLKVNFGYREFIATGDISRIERYALVSNAILISIFIACQLFCQIINR